MINYTSGEETSAGPLPEGQYDLIIKNATEGKSKAGNDMITIDLEVQGKGRSLKEFLVFTPASIWKVDLFRKAIGETVNPNENVSINAAEWIGKTCKAMLNIEPDRSDPTKKWNRIESYVLDNSPF